MEAIQYLDEESYRRIDTAVQKRYHGTACQHITLEHFSIRDILHRIRLSNKKTEIFETLKELIELNKEKVSPHENN